MDKKDQHTPCGKSFHECYKCEYCDGIKALSFKKEDNVIIWFCTKMNKSFEGIEIGDDTN